MHLQIEADEVCVCRFVYKPAIYYSATPIFLLNTFSQMSAVDPESERLFLLSKYIYGINAFSYVLKDQMSIFRFFSTDF